MTNKLAVHHSSQSADWWTPKHIIDLAVAFLGEIELDPCCNDGEPNVPARRYFRKSDNGLDQFWDARTIWLNPPYGREIKRWLEMFITNLDKGNIEEGLILVPARPDTKWFQFLLKEGFPFCFVTGRLKFYNPSLSKQTLSKQTAHVSFPYLVLCVGKSVCVLFAFHTFRYYP